MEHLDLKYLQYAISVAKAGSITKAARELYVAQPNLSRAMGELEEELGFPLFLRSKRGIVPTPQGKRFLTEAEAMLKRLSSMAREFREEKDRTIDLSCVPSSLFVNAVLDVARRCPEQSIHCQEYYNCTELFATVEKGRALAAFLTFGVEMKEALLAYCDRRKLEYRFLGQSLVYGVVRRSSPLYRPGDAPEIDYTGAEMMLNVSYFEPIGIPFQQDLASLPPVTGFCHGVGRAANLDRLESRDDLVMLACHIHSKIMRRNDLVAVPLYPERMAYEYGYVLRKNSSLESWEQRVLEEIEQEVTQELSDV